MALTITAGDSSHSFMRDNLLRSAWVRRIEVQSDPANGGRLNTYLAVPIHALFADVKIPPASALLFICKDGFSAPIDPQRLLNKDPAKSIAFLAIEPADNPWPPLRKNGGDSAGPFYLIWQDPEKSNIGKEEWPFQLVAFKVQRATQEEFPHTPPKISGHPEAPEWRGYRSFMKNCFSCHTLNGEGNSRLGPDLNIPYSPTEYLRAGFLEKQIRSPQSVHRWPQSKMTAFDKAALPDRELKDLIAYLRHMAKHKVSKP